MITPGKYRGNATIRRAKGQALPIGLALIMMGALGMLVLFNTGQMVSEKSRISNTADAAVYSGLIWQARSLNFQAYTNRAMVANQVSIAQMVSMSSWTMYGRIGSENLDYAIGWIPVVKPFTSALVSVMTQVENVVSNIAEVAIPIFDGVTRVLSFVQEGVYVAAYAATPEVVSQIVEQNDSRYESRSTYSVTQQVKNLADWESLSTRYSGGEDLERKAGVVRNSTDKFTADRSWDSVPGLPSPIQVSPVDRFAIIKEGRTQLLQDGDDFEWRGKDTLSLHWEHWSCSFSGCGWESAEIPMGWGSYYAEADEVCGAGGCSGVLKTNRTAETFADYYAEDLGSGYNGVKAYRALSDLSEDNRDPRVTLQVEVQVSNADVRTAEKITNMGSASPPDNTLKHGIEPGMFHTQDTFASDTVAGMSAGEVFFERPVLDPADELRVNGRVVQEYANLFNPYWDVRLIEVTEAQRQLAWAARDSGLASGAAAAVVQAAALERVADTGLGEYVARGQSALQGIQGNLLEEALKGLAENALSSYADNALSGYAADNGYGDLYESGRSALADGEISSEEVLNAASDYVANGGAGEGLANIVDINDNLLTENEQLANILTINASVNDTIDRVTQGLEGQLGAQLEELTGEIFSQEQDLTLQLEQIQQAVGQVADDLQTSAEEVASSVEQNARDAFDRELEGLRDEFRDNGIDISLDTEQLVGDFESQLETVLTDEVNEASDAVAEVLSGAEEEVQGYFGGRQYSPEAIENGALEDASEYLESLTASLSEQLGEAGDLVSNAGNQASDLVESTISDLREMLTGLYADQLAENNPDEDDSEDSDGGEG